MSEDRARVRIAPSPTGDPHVGTAYVALFNRTHARHNGGEFLLRIDDTDRTRYQATSEEQVFAALRWLGLDWDEGPDVGGPCSPYRQSERNEIYRRYTDKLLQSNSAYRCFCSAERMAEVREGQKQRKERLGYDGHCREISPQDSQDRAAAGESHVIRLRVPDAGETTFGDEIRGEIRVENCEIDDQILIKTDGFPTYHLANVVDDIEFKITEVVRAEEWLVSTPKHVLIYQALEESLPRFFHVPLLRNSDQSKISKRKNPVSLDWFRQQGYLKEALLNFLALMGWSPPDEEEVFDLQRFEKEFRLDDISTGAPVFDMVKLDWLNGVHIRNLGLDQLLERIEEEGFLPSGASIEDARRILPLVTERMVLLSEFADRTDWFFQTPPAPTSEQLIPKKSSAEISHRALQGAAKVLQDTPGEDTESISAALDALLEDLDIKKPLLFMPLRFALTSRKDSPDLIEVIAVLGKDAVQARLQQSVQILESLL